MVPPEILRLTFPDLGALEREIAANIRYGRLFVSEVVDLPVLTDGEIVLALNGRELRLPAQVVMVNAEGPMRGTGIALKKFGPADVETVEAFGREAAGAQTSSVAERPRGQTPSAPERPRAQTPEPRPRAQTQPFDSRERTQTPEPRPRAQTSNLRERSQTPDPRERSQTPDPRPRAATPVPMPLTLSERPRRGTPSPHEAVTVRPVTGSISMGTVPPTAPENDWSDLHTSDFAHVPKRSEAPPVKLSEAPKAPSVAPQPAASSPQPGAVADDDWSDVAAATTNEPPTLAAKGGRPGVAAAAAPQAPELDAEESSGGDSTAASAARSGGAEFAPAPTVALAEDDWSDVAAAAAEPASEQTASGSTAAAARVADDDWSDVAAAVEKPDASAADGGEAEAAENGDGFDEDAELDAAANNNGRSTELQSDHRQERLRTLNVVEQLKIARRGELSDRIVIERLYGKQVWEALLQNPRITLPEVARIARKGTVPKPLIEQIVENNQWVKEPNVRRALLSNPKLTSDGVLKLLKMMPKHELKVMEKATAFPMSVRDAARKLLREGAQ